MKLKYLPFVGAVIFTSPTFAEDIQDRWTKKEKSKWSSILSVDYSWTKYDEKSLLSDRALTNRTLSGYGIIRYSIDSDTRVQAIISGYHAYDNGPLGLRGDLINDMWLSYSKNNLWTPTKNFKMSGEARIAIPLSKRSEREDLKTAVRIGLRFSLDLSDYVEGLYISDYIRARKNFHKYKTAGEQRLIEHQLSNIFAIDYYFADKWSVSTNILYRQGWNYHNGQPAASILHSGQIGYQIKKDMDIALGLTNSATYYSPEQGPDPLDSLTDIDKSTFYFTINYLF